MRKPDPTPAAEAARVLGRVRSHHQALEAMQAAELEDVVAWADLHALQTPVDLPAVSAPGPRGTEGVLFLAGPGARGVEEFAVAELATTLRVSERAARMYLGEALELRDRLPRLYAATLAGTLPVWRARQVARQTRMLGPEVAAYVDAHLAPFAHKVNGSRITRAVDAAVRHCDPDTAKRRAEEAAEKRHVSVVDGLDGISTLTAVLHTPDAIALEQRVFVVAEWLALLGDTDPLPVRQAKALALLADPQAALDFEQRAWDHVRGTTTERPPETRRPSFDIHVHLSDAALTGLSPVARFEGPGRRLPVPLAAVEQWLSEIAPGAVLRLTPVIDTGKLIAVDRYEVPPDLAHQVSETQLACAFPWCGRRGRYDHDHIVEYVPPDEGGPPGQNPQPQHRQALPLPPPAQDPHHLDRAPHHRRHVDLDLTGRHPVPRRPHRHHDALNSRPAVTATRSPRRLDASKTGSGSAASIDDPADHPPEVPQGRLSPRLSRGFFRSRR